MIERSFDFAQDLHKNQVRESGEGFIVHIYEVAKTLVELHMDSAAIAACLLHELPSKGLAKIEKIGELFGEEVASLVAGVSREESIGVSSDEEKRAQNIRNILLATAKDIRVIIIKLADRLHNMRVLKFLSSDRQKIVSKETLEIYAPIAYKLGMYNLKAELEDLSFRYLEPDIYQDFKARIGKKQSQREQEVERFRVTLEDALKKQKLPARVFGRAKHFYSIFKKMQRKDLRFEQVTDLAAVRVITTSVENCYKILEFVQAHWVPIGDKFDDYIVSPKSNLYQSLHIEVNSDEGTPVEVQIRTLEMHHIAEEGIAAHWRYKGTARDKKFENKINWLKQILAWKRESANAREFIESLKVDLFQDEIIVFTPKGDAISLREDATPIDFAYMVHSNIGDHCVRAKVNGKIVPLETQLRAGDRIEIMTSPDAKPSRQWLKFVKSTHAKNKIRKSLGLPLSDSQNQAGIDEPSELDLLGKVSCSAVKPNDLRYAHCCMPKLYEEIIGFLQKDGKVAIHRKACVNISGFEPQKLVDAGWIGGRPDQIEAEIEVYVKDRVGLLVELLNHVSRRKINILSINSKPAKDLVKLSLILSLDSEQGGMDLMIDLRKVHSVDRVIWELPPSKEAEKRRRRMDAEHRQGLGQ